ncbi:MAG: hypothetical protein RJA07_2554 [Bacteroidota bacterium]|jgi:hypothetical protein
MIKNIKQPSLLLTLFIFLCAFPTIRYVVVGRDSISIFDYLFSSLPDVLSIGVIMFSMISFFAKNKTLSLSKIDKIFIGYFLFSIIYGCILSRDIKACILGFRLSYLPMLFYFVGKYIDESKENFSKKYLDPIFSLFGVIGLVGFFLYFFVPAWNMKIIGNITGAVNQYLIVRMTSIFWTPVVFGTSMGFTLLYFVHKYFVSEKITKLNWIFISFSWFGLVLSVSRGPIICFVLMMLLMFYVFKNTQKTLRILILFICLYVISILFASLQQQILYNGGNFFSLFYNMVNFTVKSAAETATMEQGLTRVELWQRSWISFVQQPWGYGLGKSGHIAWRLFKNTNIPSSPYSTDGWYLKLLGETGILGAAFFSVLLFYFANRIKKMRLLFDKSITTFLVLLFIFVLIQNIVSNVVDYYCIAPLFYMLLGYCTKYFYNEKG